MKKRRHKGLGSIVKIGKTYYLRIKIKDKIRGKYKVIVKTLHTSNEDEAKINADAIAKPLMAATTKEEFAVHIGQSKRIIKRWGKGILIDDVWKRFIKDSKRRNCSGVTLKRYGQYWERFKKWLAGKYSELNQISEITDELASEYCCELQKSKVKKIGKRKIKFGISGRAFNAHLQALRLVFKVVGNEETRNPFREVVVAKQQTRLVSRKEFSEDEVLKILDSFHDKKLKVKYKKEMEILFNLGVWTGLRLGDCALIEWQNIDFEGDRILCTPMKTIRSGKSIVIPMHSRLRNVLNQAFKERKKGGYVQPGIAAYYKKNPYGLQKELRAIFSFSGFAANLLMEDEQKYGLRMKSSSVYGFHSFRHSFVSFCAQKGVPSAVVQAIVGHGSPAMTRHYTHIGEESIRNAIKALPMGEERVVADQGDSDMRGQNEQLGERINKAISLIKSNNKLNLKFKESVLSILRG